MTVNRFQGRLEASLDLEKIFAHLSLDAEGNLETKSTSGVRVREAWLEHVEKHWDVRVGRQNIIWGKMDGVRITDNICPPDYADFMLRSNEDLHKPVCEFSDFIKSLPLTKRASSILDILKDMNQTLHGGEPGQYRIADTQEEIAQQLLLYENAGGREAEHWVDYDYRRLRLLIEIGDYRSGEAARELELIKAKGRELFPDASILLTGALIQFSVMQDYVSWGQIQSFGISILVISLLMSIVFGSVKLGLVSMIPNISPALLAGAMMGYFDFPLDIMTVTVMPMLLGLSVDDTIHFINHAQLEFSRTGSYAESVRRTFLTTGRSMMITTVILCVCFLAYLISDIAVFFRLGILVAGGAVAALLADYFVTPVLLAKLRCFGPEGRPASGQTAG